MTGTDKGREKQGRPLECKTKCDHCHLRATTHGIRGKTAVSQLKRRRKVFEQAENPGERDGNPAQRGQIENRKRDGRDEHGHAHVRLNQSKTKSKALSGRSFRTPPRDVRAAGNRLRRRDRDWLKAKRRRPPPREHGRLGSNGSTER